LAIAIQLRRTIDGVLGQPLGTPSMLQGYQGTAWRDTAEAGSAAKIRAPKGGR
jgi:hypothetical protein